MKVKAGADFLPVAQEVGQLAQRHEPDARDDHTATAASAAWQELVAGGWLGLGTDAGALELAEAARAWGAHLVPAPFITSVLVSRWHGKDTATAATCGVPSPSGAVAPFADWPDIDIIASSRPGSSAASPARTPGAAADDFAPSLALIPCSHASELEPVAGRELAMMWAAEAIGGAQRALRTSVEYAGQRSAYGHLIGSYQAVAHLLADMHRDAEFGWSGVVWAAQGGDDGLEAAQAAIGLAADVIRGAIQVHGGIGYTWELGLHRYLRHAMAVADLARGLASAQIGNAR